MKSSTEENKAQLILSIHELVLLNNALNEICNGPDAIEEGEFHSRTGSDLNEAKELLSQFSNTLEALKEKYPEEYYGATATS